MDNGKNPEFSERAGRGAESEGLDTFDFLNISDLLHKGLLIFKEQNVLHFVKKPLTIDES